MHLGTAGDERANPGKAPDESGSAMAPQYDTSSVLIVGCLASQMGTRQPQIRFRFSDYRRQRASSDPFALGYVTTPHASLSPGMLFTGR